MSQRVERAVAQFLGSGEIDLEKLKPVISFVVLWNRLEAKSQCQINIKKLQQFSDRVAGVEEFSIEKYEPHIDFFIRRYTEFGDLIERLVWAGRENSVEYMIRELVHGNLTDPKEILYATLLIPYRIRNNLFHGRKDTFRLYTQTGLFTHVNEILCLFHSDLA